MYVADDIVYVVLEYHYFGVSRFGKYRFQFLERRVYLYRINLGTWHQAVPYLYAREIQRVLENPHVIVDILFLIGIVKRRLYKVIQFSLRECGVADLILDSDIEDAQ